jgi:chlorite dismutase
MRFDEASAIYAEFGRFFVGMVCPIDELVDRLGLT